MMKRLICWKCVSKQIEILNMLTQVDAQRYRERPQSPQIFFNRIYYKFSEFRSFEQKRANYQVNNADVPKYFSI